MSKVNFQDSREHCYLFTLLMISLSISHVICVPSGDARETSIKHYPYVVVLRIRRESGATGMCVGVLLTANSILTAASCLYDVLPKKVVAYVGITDRSRITEEEGVQERVSKHIAYHSAYCPVRTCNGTLSGYNLGVVRTKKPFQFTRFCHYASFQYSWIDYANVTATVVGWYFTHDNISQQKLSVLHELQTEILDENCEVCNLLPTHSICVHQPDQQNLIGEAGSPLVHNGHVIGIRAYRTLSMNRSILTFENVFMFRHWIQCASLSCDANFYRYNRSFTLNLLQFFLLWYHWFDL